MDLHLKNKTTVITGSTAGIGLAIASLLAKENANVVINSRTQKRVAEAVKQIKKAGAKGKVRGIAGDLATARGVEEFVREVPTADILINKLGIFEPKPFEEIPDEDWMRFTKGSGQSASEFEKEFFTTARPSSLLKRFAKPEEVAPMVAFLCSPLSSATNGAACAWMAEW